MKPPILRSYFVLLAAILCLALLPVRSAFADQLADDEAAIATHIQALHDESSEVREAAAKALREIVARYPSGTTNLRDADGGKARWMEKVNQVTSNGTTYEEAIKILSRPERTSEDVLLSVRGIFIDSYRLDNHWTVTLRHRQGKVVETPALSQSELSISVKLPQNYTGRWAAWYVNGQKAGEAQYVDGRANGSSTGFHHNGRKWIVQHWAKNGLEGASTAWYADGKLMFTKNYKDGFPHGKQTFWYPNGQKQDETNYIHGARHGLEVRWDEQGVVQSRKEYKYGQEVP